MPNYKMWINGQWVESESGQTYTVLNPATEEPIAQVPAATRADVDKAVKAARAAAPGWAALPQAERSRLLYKIAAALTAHREEIARVDVIDHGSPISLARMQAFMASMNLEYCAQAGRALLGDSVPLRNNLLFSVQREPQGVCALIIPWNSPLLMLSSKMGAALTTGNTCVIKPAAIDSLSTLKVAEILATLDLPPGIINIVTGSGGTTGEALASHPDINMISFTGGSETGKQIMALASPTLKKLQMELGGKNPFIVLEDADIDRIIPRVAAGTCHNSGMVCATPGRFYIHEKLHDEFVERFVNEIRKVRVGDPNDEKTDMGPVVSAEHRDRVEGFIQSGIAEGANLILGGRRPSVPPFDRGYYIMPTVFTGVKPRMQIFREEIFGPVACFVKFSTDEEVIQSANDNQYGLCASVWTRDIARGLRLINRVNAGAVGVNSAHFISGETPWGGFKDSGIGVENSLHGLAEFTRLRLFSVNFG
jgi:acyl-CoA reductase-like NAD-dependent aldehyde dehydrogenase